MKTYILIGDSQAEGLLSHIRELMQARGFIMIGAATQSGWSTSRFVEAQSAVALGTLRPDVALFVLGGNDSAGTAMARSVLAGDIGRLLQQLRTGGSPHVIWIGPAHSTNEGVNRRHEGVAVVQRAILPALGVEWHDGAAMTDDLGHAADGTHFPRTSLIRWAARIDQALFTNERGTRWVGAAALLAAAAGIAGIAWIYFR